MLNLEESFGDAQMDRTDGLKLIWPDRWIHVRASNTEPLLRFSTEAKSQGAMEALYSDVESRLR
jgi:phosphomannomutase